MKTSPHPYAAITIEQMDREASRARAAMDLPRGTHDLAPWRAGMMARAGITPKQELPAGPFDLFMADPAWAFAVRSPRGAKKSASQHYATMSLDEIKALPVAACAANGPSVLLLWAIDPMIPQALEVMAAWGFTFKTVGFYWAKTTLDGSGFPIGTGYYTRANPELCLLGTRGGTLPRADRGVRKLIVSPRREHSRKPDEAYERAERLFGDVRRLDLFARQERPGWTAWGNETGRFPMPAFAAAHEPGVPAPVPVDHPPADRLATTAGSTPRERAPAGFSQPVE